MSAQVLCTSTHPIDLADGRTLGPGETAEDVPVGNRHNADLIESGHLLVLDAPGQDGGEANGDAGGDGTTPPDPDPAKTKPVKSTAR